MKTTLGDIAVGNKFVLGDTQIGIRVENGYLVIEEDGVPYMRFVPIHRPRCPVADLGPVEFTEPKPLPRIDRDTEGKWKVFSERHPNGREPMVGDEFETPVGRGGFECIPHAFKGCERWKFDNHGRYFHPDDITIHRLADDPQTFVEPTVEELKRMAEASWTYRRSYTYPINWLIQGPGDFTGRANTYEEAITYIRQQMK